MSRANTLRKAGVKLVGKIVLWDTSSNLMRISTSADLRQKFAASIMAAMEKLQLDGFNLEWMWPGCPAVKSHKIIDRAQTTANLLSTHTKVTQLNFFRPSVNL
jgi:GH18 family chitinase